MTVENPDVENSVDMIAVQWPGSGAFVCGAMAMVQDQYGDWHHLLVIHHPMDIVRNASAFPCKICDFEYPHVHPDMNAVRHNGQFFLIGAEWGYTPNRHGWMTLQRN
jgi:hypothetical protein